MVERDSESLLLDQPEAPLLMPACGVLEAVVQSSGLGFVSLPLVNLLLYAYLDDNAFGRVAPEEGFVPSGLSWGEHAVQVVAPEYGFVPSESWRVDVVRTASYSSCHTDLIRDDRGQCYSFRNVWRDENIASPGVTGAMQKLRDIQSQNKALNFVQPTHSIHVHRHRRNFRKRQVYEILEKIKSQKSKFDEHQDFSLVDPASWETNKDFHESEEEVPELYETFHQSNGGFCE